jgi:NAD(P)-dependent dehydrogenase (short-subunit alcohol dehydrogenase family)
MMPHALITGGQQGIGLGIAAALAAAGFRLTLAAEQPEDARVVREALERLPDGTRYFRHDLTRIDAIAALLDAVGEITTLVSNAGVPAMARGDLLDMAPESFDRCMAVNLRGTFFLAQEAARRMLRRRSATYRSLIFVTSISARDGQPRARRLLHLEGRGRDGRAELCPAPCARRDRRLRTAPRHHRHRDDRGVRDTYDRPHRGRASSPPRRWGQPADIGRGDPHRAAGNRPDALCHRRR